MPNHPRPVKISPASFTVSFLGHLSTSEFKNLTNKIGADRRVERIIINSIFQTVKVEIDEAFIDSFFLIRRSIIDMLMGNNCSPHVG